MVCAGIMPFLIRPASPQERPGDASSSGARVTGTHSSVLQPR